MRPTSTALRVLYYALGGGRGHATRSRLLSQWFPPGTNIHFILPQRLQSWSRGLQVHLVSPSSLGVQVAHLLRKLRPDLLVVDTFPRGVLGELAELDFPCPAWLVARWLKLSYALRPEVVTALGRYHKILQCELTPWEQGCQIGPVVATPPQPQGKRKILWLGSGPLETQCLLSQALPSEAVMAAPDLGQSRQDVAQLLASASLVISASGYNAYHEIVQAGTPAIFWPQARLYDEQNLRAGGRLGPKPRGWHRCVDDLPGLQAALTQWRDGKPASAGPLPLGRPELVRSLFT
ncbi:hypothetical protein IV102_21085 [bacterium]|nr:hypothetical protein [bacterium]